VRPAVSNATMYGIMKAPPPLSLKKGGGETPNISQTNS
jgi:hypothetical protein